MGGSLAGPCYCAIACLGLLNNTGVQGRTKQPFRRARPWQPTKGSRGSLSRARGERRAAPNLAECTRLACQETVKQSTVFIGRKAPNSCGSPHFRPEQTTDILITQARQSGTDRAALAGGANGIPSIAQVHSGRPTWVCLGQLEGAQLQVSSKCARARAQQCRCSFEASQACTLTHWISAGPVMVGNRKQAS